MGGIRRPAGALFLLVLWAFLATPARCEPPPAGALEPPPPDAAAPWRVNPAFFARPAQLTAFPRCTDPFQIARGPAEIRDEFMLAQVRLTLPAVSPDVLPRGRWLLRLHQDSGTDFAFSQTGAAESPAADRRFLVDGERHTWEAQARRGFGGGLDAGIRVPVRWRGGGWLDGLVDWWHERFGFQDNSRGAFDPNRYRVEGRDAAFNAIDWPEQGWGLGNVELDARWEFLCPACRSGWRAAVIGRVGLPTGTGPYETGGVDLGLQAVAARQLGRRFDVYGGVGGTWFSEDTIQGIEYEPWRGHGFLAVEWRATAFLSVLVQTDASSRLVTNLVDYPALQWYLMVGAKADLGGGWRLTAGLTENFADQQSTSDVDFWTSLEVVF
jgi:hypothetical protein